MKEREKLVTPELGAHKTYIILGKKVAVYRPKEMLADLKLDCMELVDYSKLCGLDIQMDENTTVLIGDWLTPNGVSAHRLADLVRNGVEVLFLPTRISNMEDARISLTADKDCTLRAKNNPGNFMGTEETYYVGMLKQYAAVKDEWDRLEKAALFTELVLTTVPVLSWVGEEKKYTLEFKGHEESDTSESFRIEHNNKVVGVPYRVDNSKGVKKIIECKGDSFLRAIMKLIRICKAGECVWEYSPKRGARYVKNVEVQALIDKYGENGRED